MKIKKDFLNNEVAFSLIEMSMVLLILALLGVSITSIASLIETAKVRSFISITDDWKKDINAFYSLKGRLPSNLNNSYYIGELYYRNWAVYAKKVYTLSNFGLSNYEGLDGATAISTCGAFWLDMYLAKTSDFKPNASGIKACGTSGAAPELFNGDLRAVGPKTINFKDNNGIWPQFRNAMNGVYFQFVDTNTHIKSRVFYKIDQKIDDGVYNEGKMRSFCYSDRTKHDATTSVDYKTAINNGYLCHDFYYELIGVEML